MIRDKAALFGAARLKSKVVKLDSLPGEEIEITELSLAGRAGLSEIIKEGNAYKIGLKVAAQCVPILADVAEDEIATKLNPDVVVEISNKVFELSGLLEEEKKD